MSATFKTIKEYLLQPSKRFVVPNYQRGYKWAVKEKGDTPSAIEKLVTDLLKAYDSNQKTPQEYFIQGITVCEENDEIILIDGQQRTTSLYLLFWSLNKSYISDINLHYDIRKESKAFIHSLRENVDFDPETGSDKQQDIYYFKEAIRQVNRLLEKRMEEDGFGESFYRFILNEVKILYIVIEADKATKTFTMMNGSKATMLYEELIKAEMLRTISLSEAKEDNNSTSEENQEYMLREKIAQEWETNALRSRYAREWDKWLYWWNREDVITFFKTKGRPMGLLLSYYYKRIYGEKRDFRFDHFRELLRDKQATQEHFKGLRNLQKSFEDIYNNPLLYNSLGLSLIDDRDDKFNIINHFIENKNKVALLADFAKWRVIGATFRQITKTEELKEKELKAQAAFNALGAQIVYGSEGDAYARKYLLYLNVIEDNKLNNGQGRKFDFSIYGSQSLEHIHPKSKVFYMKEDGYFYNGSDERIGDVLPVGEEWLNRDCCSEEISEHCIGNLVLLEKRDNSEFGNKSFQKKKEIYFDVSTDKYFKSRSLIHTMSVFAKASWTITDIKENRDKIMKQFEEMYGVNSNIGGTSDE